MENLHEAYNRDSEKLHKTELAKAHIEGDQKNLQNRIWDTYKLTYAGAEEFRRTPFDEKESDRAAELQGQIRALGTVNVGAVEEYAETKARVDDLTTQQQDLKRAEMDLRELIERLLIQMRSTFVENFSKMQGYFAETFTRLFGGGHAELKLMDPELRHRGQRPAAGQEIAAPVAALRRGTRADGDCDSVRDAEIEAHAVLHSGRD